MFCSMNLEGDVSLLDSFIHTQQDQMKIMNFDFIRENSTTKEEKVMVDQTFCTLVTVGGKFLRKKALKKVLKKTDDIRKKIIPE